MNSDIAIGNRLLGARCEKDTLELALTFGDEGSNLGGARSVELVGATAWMEACHTYPATCSKPLADKLIERFQTVSEEGGAEAKGRAIAKIQELGTGRNTCVDLSAAVEIFKHAYSCGALIGLRGKDAREMTRDAFFSMSGKKPSSKAAADTFFDSYVKQLPALPTDFQ